ncbi:Ubiquitin carboxyl-terminal hydrolase domain-containing protein [Phytophthora infestans]|uniref:Ubiquitin carboxyl-terminal hydrolase n=1 Tax=Phytophthora infestans TaxID=4787 RepID=A0A833WDP2_PHYIN|nr:Ubiquitin carboxyl-terminal hydrolase domain-containing protein [Phytophthora infestans]
MGKGKKKQSKKNHKRKQNGAPVPTSEDPVAPASNHSLNSNGSGKGGNPLSNDAAKRLDRNKQRAIIKRLMTQADEQGLQMGDKRFVLSAKWWERWREFVGYDDKQDRPATGAGNPAPSRINNLPLLHVGSDTPLDELMGGPLRPQLKENYHYVLLPQEVWDALLIWYSGGPTIARFVVQVGDPELGNAFNRVQVYPEQPEDAEPEATTNGTKDSSMQKIDANGKNDDSADGAKLAVQRKPAAVSCSIPKICGACRKPTGSLKRCGSCQLIWYCGANCQMSHWKYHKGVCRSTLTAEEKEDDILQGLQAERRGKMGLRNLGNTCFMNSALQCLSHVELLTRYFLSNQYKKDLNRDNPLGTGGNLAEEYDGLLKELWFGTVPSTSPANLKRAISRFAPQFSGFQQHDAQELLAYIIDGLHEDLNRVKHKPYTEVNESDGSQDDAAVAKEAWQRHLLRNDSIFVDHVQGQFKSTVVCPICNKVSITFDPFNCIQLELPQQMNRQIEVIFVPSESAKSMTRYLVDVPKKGSVLVLKRALSKLCGVSPSSLLAADIYQSMTYRIIGDTERVHRFREDDRILMYQVDVKPTEEPVQYGFLYHRVGSTLTGDPLLFTYTASTTCAEMLATWSELLNTHVSQSSSAKIPTNMLSQCVFLTDRDGILLRNEPVPPAADSKFLDFATLHGEELPGELVFVSVAWSPSMLSSSASPRPDVERIVNHESMRAKSSGSRGHDGISLDDCFRNFVKPETLDQANLWYCSKCNEHRQARKTMEMWRLPDVLVLSLKRFEYRNEILRDKLDVYVDFPLEGLDMSPYCLEKSDDKDHLSYDLFAVSNHYGSMGFGHYTAFAKSWKDEGEMYPGWYSFDDSLVAPAMPNQVKSNAAYILFYKRKNLQVEPTRSYNKTKQS